MEPKQPSIAALAPNTRSPERIAWGVILIAFGVFMLSCAGSTAAVYYFFFESTVSLETDAQNSRGTLAYIGADFNQQLIDGVRSVSSGAIISPADTLSQGVVAVRDPQRDNALVALLTLYSDASSVTMNSTQRPRFDWSDKPYQISFSEVRGRIDVFIAPDLEREVVLDLRSMGGTLLRLTNTTTGDAPYLAGTYFSLAVVETGLRVHNINGRAVAITSDQAQGWDVPMGARVSINVDSSQPLPTPINLIDNSYFERVNQEGDRLPETWGCRSAPLNPPSGKYTTEPGDGLGYLRFLRGDGATSPRETGCEQPLRDSSGAALDVTGYESLVLRTQFYIQYQSLSTCGFLGSECPLMVRLGYLTAEGEEHELIYGFFHYRDPTLDYPMRCDTCVQPHIPIEGQTWYTYETDNLFEILPEAQRPTALTTLRFYASGHQYDVRVSEMSILAQQGIVEDSTVQAGTGSE